MQVTVRVKATNAVGVFGARYPAEEFAGGSGIPKKILEIVAGGFELLYEALGYQESNAVDLAPLRTSPRARPRESLRLKVTRLHTRRP